MKQNETRICFMKRFDSPESSFLDIELVKDRKISFYCKVIIQIVAMSYFFFF